MAILDWVRGPTLGRGSFATVSLASSPSSGEVFAVKSAKLSRSSSLQREQTILSALQDCPSIVSCLGYDVSDDTYNLFLEYAPGGSLSDHIKKKKGGCLDELTIQSLTCDILIGLSYLRCRGLVHCDIKSDNILVGSDGRAMIADFGCARWMADCRDSQIRGSPMFMAPEVAQGEEQGPAADVWALGCTIIEMATGQPAWPGMTDPMAILHHIAYSDDTPKLPRWVSSECKDFLDKCLKRNPNDRWSADQLLKHSFAAIAQGCPSKPSWDSPKSTLDLGLSESIWTDEVDELEEHYYPSLAPSQRIQQTVGTRPNWTWDDDWLPVRSNLSGVQQSPEEDEDPNSIEESVSVVILAGRSRGDMLPSNNSIKSTIRCKFEKEGNESPKCNHFYWRSTNQQAGDLWPNSKHTLAHFIRCSLRGKKMLEP